MISLDVVHLRQRVGTECLPQWATMVLVVVVEAVRHRKRSIVDLPADVPRLAGVAVVLLVDDSTMMDLETVTVVDGSGMDGVDSQFEGTVPTVMCRHAKFKIDIVNTSDNCWFLKDEG